MGQEIYMDMQNYFWWRFTSAICYYYYEACSPRQINSLLVRSLLRSLTNVKYEREIQWVLLGGGNAQTPHLARGEVLV
jgi:hypothetical protein